jgi:hypothetical protein
VTWDGETEGLGSLEIDDEAELLGLLDWEIGRLRARQNAIDEAGGHSPISR